MSVMAKKTHFYSALRNYNFYSTISIKHPSINGPQAALPCFSFYRKSELLPLNNRHQLPGAVRGEEQSHLKSLFIEIVFILLNH